MSSYNIYNWHQIGNSLEKTNSIEVWRQSARGGLQPSMYLEHRYVVTAGIAPRFSASLSHRTQAALLISDSLVSLARYVGQNGLRLYCLEQFVSR